MFKISKKLIVMSILSLSLSQVGFAPFVEGESFEPNHFKTADKTPEEIEALKEQAKKLFNFHNKTFRTHKDQQNAIDDESEKLLERNDNDPDTIIDAGNLLRKETPKEFQQKQEIARKEEAARQEEKNKRLQIYSLSSSVDLSKSTENQSDSLKEQITQLTEPEREEFAANLAQIIKNLPQKELVKIDSSYFNMITPDQIKNFNFETINQLSNAQLTEMFKKEENKNALKERIAKFTPVEIVKLNKILASYLKFITSDQIKALLKQSKLVDGLTPEKISALDPQALADAIKGDRISNLKNKISNNYLPQSFVDALTPEQAEDIIDMHKKSKGRFFDNNDLKYFFSDSQIQILENKAQAAATGKYSKEEADARNIVIKLLDNPKLLEKNLVNFDEEKKAEAMRTEFKKTTANLTTKQLETIINEFTTKINTEESKWFGLKKSILKSHKESIQRLKTELNNFIENFVKPSLRPSAWAFEYADPKTKTATIKIVDMENALEPVPFGAKLRASFLEDENLTLSKAQEEYSKWYVATKTPTLKPLDTTNLDKFNSDLRAAIDKALTEKVNRLINNGSIKIENLDPSYIPYVDISRLSSDQIRALTTEQIKVLTTEQIKVLTTEQIKALTADQIATFSDNQVKTLSETQKKALRDKISNLSTSRYIPDLANILSKSQSDLIKSEATKTITDQLETNTSNFPAKYIKYVEMEEISSGTISELSADQIASLSNDQYNLMNQQQQQAVQDNLSKLSDEQLREINTKIQSSKLAEFIKPRLGTVAVRPEPTQTTQFTAEQFSPLGTENNPTKENQSTSENQNQSPKETKNKGALQLLIKPIKTTASTNKFTSSVADSQRVLENIVGGNEAERGLVQFSKQ